MVEGYNIVVPSLVLLCGKKRIGLILTDEIILMS